MPGAKNRPLSPEQRNIVGIVPAATRGAFLDADRGAVARGLNTKHAVQPGGIDLDAILPHWVSHVVGTRVDIKIAMDWSDFDANKQTTIMLSLMTGHGRATPLAWLNVDTATLKAHRNEYETRVLVHLSDMLPSGIKVCIVADLGFGDRKLY